MKLPPMSYIDHLGPYLLGTFEFQLHPWIAQIAGNQYSQIINIGCSFGYYTVGLARLFPGIPVFAFDTDWWARAACREMAFENRTSNVEVAGFCSPAWLDRNLMPSSLILSDCEGHEADLLTPLTGLAVSSATLIIETHDEINPGVTDAIMRRFARSHRLTTEVVDLESVLIPPVDLSFLTADETRSALREIRGRQTWLLLTPNPRPPA
jgi:trans-aconitate methyltransferase